MNDVLQTKCELLASNYVTVQKSGKLEFGEAATLGAFLLTAQNAVANEEKIRACRKILKSKVGIFSNLRGFTNIALLSRMSNEADPEGYLDRVLAAYDHFGKNEIIRTEYLVLAAMCLVDAAEPARYDEIVSEADIIVDKMVSQHPMLSGQNNSAIAALVALTDIDPDEFLANAEACFQAVRADHPLMSGTALQIASQAMAFSSKSVEEKVARYLGLNDALADAGHKIGGYERAILAAFTDIDANINEVVAQIGEADEFLKHKKGFGMLGVGQQMRRLYAAALVLQTYDKPDADDGVAATVGSAVTATIIHTIIFIIVCIIIAACVSSSISSSSNN